MLDERHRIGRYDPDHPPREIELIEAFRIIRTDEELMIPRSVTRLLGLGIPEES